MNCQKYRQYCTLDPTCQDEDFLSHKQACPACAAFTEDMMRFEQTLVEAIKVEIPEGLTERILHQQSNRQDMPGVLVRFTSLIKRLLHWQTSHSQVASPWYRHPLYVLAASLLLAFTLFVSSPWWWQADTLPLNREIIAYVESTPQAFLTSGEVPPAELREMFQAIGAKLIGEIGKVNFCKVFTFHGHTSAHMVLTGTKGPINVLLIRDSQMTGPQSLSNGELKGIILSAASWGNIAIIGVPEEPLDKVAARLNEGVKWL